MAHLRWCLQSHLAIDNTGMHRALLDWKLRAGQSDGLEAHAGWEPWQSKRPRQSAGVVPLSPTHRELPFVIGPHSSTATYHQPLNAIRTFPGLAVQIVWNGRISHRHTTSVAVLQQTVFAMPADQQHLNKRTEKPRGVSGGDWPSTTTPDRSSDSSQGTNTQTADPNASSALSQEKPSKYTIYADAGHATIVWEKPPKDSAYVGVRDTTPVDKNKTLHTPRSSLRTFSYQYDH